MDKAISPKRVELHIKAHGGVPRPVSMCRYHVDRNLVVAILTTSGDCGEFGSYIANAGVFMDCTMRGDTCKYVAYNPLNLVDCRFENNLGEDGGAAVSSTVLSP